MMARSKMKQLKYGMCKLGQKLWLFVPIALEEN